MFPQGHPSSQPGLNCATLNAGKASKWESDACNKKLGYICRRGNSTVLPPALGKLKYSVDNHILYINVSEWVSIPISPSLSLVKNQPIFCPNHWVPYAGNCYYLERNKMMWRDALAACHKEGGDLASIQNIEEQSFIFSQSGYCKCVQNHLGFIIAWMDYLVSKWSTPTHACAPQVPTDVLWVGLNDQRNQMLFEWSDRSPVSFTYWQSGEPSHANNLQEDCVLIRGKVLPAAVQQKWFIYLQVNAIINWVVDTGGEVGRPHVWEHVWIHL